MGLVFDFYLVSILLFCIALWGIFVVRRNLIIVLISIELMLLSLSLGFIMFSVYLDDMIGQVFAFLILTIAAAESAIGLALLVVFYRIGGLISMIKLVKLKG